MILNETRITAVVPLKGTTMGGKSAYRFPPPNPNFWRPVWNNRPLVLTLRNNLPLNLVKKRVSNEGPKILDDLGFGGTVTRPANGEARLLLRSFKWFKGFIFSVDTQRATRYRKQL